MVLSKRLVQFDEKCWGNNGYRSNFEEAIQKGIRMIGQGMHGFVANKEKLILKTLEEELSNPTEMRIFAIAEAFENGLYH